MFYIIQVENGLLEVMRNSATTKHEEFLTALNERYKNYDQANKYPNWADEFKSYDTYGKFLNTSQKYLRSMGKKLHDGIREEYEETKALIEQNLNDVG